MEEQKQKTKPVKKTMETNFFDGPPPTLMGQATTQVYAEPEAIKKMEEAKKEQEAKEQETKAPEAKAPEAEKEEFLEQPKEAGTKKKEPLPPVNPMVGENGLLLSQNFNEEWKLAAMMANSEMVPDHFRGKTAAVMMAMQTAKSRGMNPLTAIQKTANIFGNTSTFGELPLAEVFESKKLKTFIEFFIDESGKEIVQSRGKIDLKSKVFGAVCICEAENSPQGEVMRIFTLEDAKNANLLDDPKRKTWRQYTKRMLQMRARGWALKDSVPEITSGIKMPGYDDHADELIDITPKAGSLASKLNETLALPNAEKEI